MSSHCICGIDKDLYNKIEIIEVEEVPPYPVPGCLYKKDRVYAMIIPETLTAMSIRVPELTFWGWLGSGSFGKFSGISFAVEQITGQIINTFPGFESDYNYLLNILKEQKLC